MTMMTTIMMLVCVDGHDDSCIYFTSIAIDTAFSPGIDLQTCRDLQHVLANVVCI